MLPQVTQKTGQLFFRPAQSEESSSNLENADGDDEPKFVDNESGTVNSEGKKGKLKEVATIHQKYSEHPKSMDNVCLAQFATSYHSIKKSSLPKDL